MSTTIGHKYFLGIHMMTCYMVEALREIWVGESKVWGVGEEIKYLQNDTSGAMYTGTVTNEEITANRRLVVSEPDLFGGDKQEGGIEGWVDVEFGKADQVVNEYMGGEDYPEHDYFRALGTAAPEELFKGNFHRSGSSDGSYPRYEHDTEDFAISAPSGTGHKYIITSKANVASLTPAHWYFMRSSPTGILNRAGGRYYPQALGTGDLYLSSCSSAFELTSVPGSIDPGGDVANVPAYRNLMGFVLNQTYIGTGNYPKPWSFVLRRTTKDVEGADIWYPAKADINGDMNPIHIIYEILTSKIFGLGMDVSRIDLGTDPLVPGSFIAAADILYAEDFGLSFKFDSSGNADDFIQEILNYINGYLRVDNATGQFQIILLRSDYVVGDLDTVDDTHITELADFSRNTIHGLVNQMSVNFTDQETWSTSTATVQDIAKIAIQGSIISMNKEYLGVTKAALANTLATRDLKLESTPLFGCTLDGLPELRKYNIGDVFKLVWAPLGIVSAIVRVVGVEAGKMTDSSVRLTVAEDVFSTVFSVFADPTGGGWEPPGVDPEDVVSRKIIEVPYWHIARDIKGVDVASALTTELGYVQVSSERPNDATLDADLWTKLSTASNYALSRINVDFVEFTELVDALDDSTGQAVFAISNTNEGFAASLVDTYIILDDEYLLVVSVDDETGELTAERGILDTIAETHAIGTILYTMGETIAYDDTEYPTGTTVDAKLLPSTGKGTLSIDDATSFSTTIAHRMLLPYPPGNVVFAQYPELRVSWSHRSRIDQVTELILQTDTTDYGPESGGYYEVKLYRDSVLIKTQSTATKQVEWGLQNMAEDFGIVSVDVTGVDAPVTGTFLPTTVQNGKYKFEATGALIEFTDDYGGIVPVEVTGDGAGTYVFDEVDATTALNIYRKFGDLGVLEAEIVPEGPLDKVVVSGTGVTNVDLFLDEYIYGDYSYRLGGTLLTLAPLPHYQAVNFTGGYNPGTYDLPANAWQELGSGYNYGDALSTETQLKIQELDNYTMESDDPGDPLEMDGSVFILGFVGGFHKLGDPVGIYDTHLTRANGGWILHDAGRDFSKTDADNDTGVGTYETSSGWPVRNATVAVEVAAPKTSWWVFEDLAESVSFIQETRNFSDPLGTYSRWNSDDSATMLVESAVTPEGQNRSWGWVFSDGSKVFRSGVALKTLPLIGTFYNEDDFVDTLTTVRTTDAASFSYKLEVDSHEYFKSPAGSVATGTYRSAEEELNSETGLYEYHRSLSVKDGVLTDAIIWVYKDGVDEFIKSSNATILEGEYVQIDDDTVTFDVARDPVGTLLEDMKVEVLSRRGAYDANKTQVRLLPAP